MVVLLSLFNFILCISLSYRNLCKVYGLQIEGSYYISVILYFAYVAV